MCRARKPSNGAGLIRKSRPAVAPKNRSLFFDDLLDDKLREFNPRYAEAEGALLGQFCHLHTDIDLQPRLRGCLSRAPQRGRIGDEKLGYATPKGVSRQSDCFFVAYDIFSDI